MADAAILPSVDDVAALLRARTMDQYGKEIDAFTADTRPTDVQVQDLIDKAGDMIELHTGTVPAVGTLQERAQSAVLLQAAILVETSYYPEQANQEQSAAQLYMELLTTAVRDLSESILQNVPGGDGLFSRMSSLTVRGVTYDHSLMFPWTYGAGGPMVPWTPLDAFAEQRDLDEVP